ncbi:helix-turn-helix domain-containing protein [Acetobacter sacchari]|uniref:Helix-turn-helix domain-containing protein n=1 Tax=Acetobacter sacchari TaxID=2661687 RepID=A0ABS3LZV8_9PROT|nr:helix-turn-helix domain-containing protein [Acetobacter sacchari]
MRSTVKQPERILLRPGEAARMLGVTTATVRAWLDKGKIAGYNTKVGCHPRYDRISVQNYLEQTKGGDRK